MRKTINKIVVATSFALVSPMLMADQGVTYTCTMEGTQDRIIEVTYKTEGSAVPCEVLYTKEGETKSLWRYENTQGECEKRAAEFAEKQRAWGMSCNTNGEATPPAVPAEEIPMQPTPMETPPAPAPVEAPAQ